MDDIAQLRSRLSGVAGEREACQRALARLGRAVDACRGQLAAMLDQPADSSGVQSISRRIHEVVCALEAEVKQAHISEHPDAFNVDAPPGSPSRSYGVLRQSLEESQRRCEGLNNDMARQAEGNEELMQTLSTAKDTNKRLVEQIRAQTEEITRLTQQRVADEERAEGLRRKHQMDKAEFEKESQQRFASVREAATNKYNQMYAKLAEKMRRVHSRLDSMAHDVARLREDGVQKVDLQGVAEAMAERMRGLEQELVFRITEYTQNHAQKRDAVESTLNELSSQLSQEREMRHQESSSWAARRASDSAERDDVQARSSRDVEELSALIRALESALRVERSVNVEDRAANEQQRELLCAERDELSRTLDQLRHEVMRLEGLSEAYTTDIRGKEQAIGDLQRQIRESDDAYAAAMSGNEHLKAQMTEQRQRILKVSEADVTLCRSGHEERLARAKDLHEAEVAAIRQQIRELEESTADRAGELAALAEQDAESEREVEALRLELYERRSRCDDVESSRRSLEGELAEARREYAAEKLRLQAAVEQIGPQNAETEVELRNISDKMTTRKRAAMSQDTELTSCSHALEDLLGSTRAQTTEVRNKLAEMGECLERMRANSAAEAESARARRASLEEELALKQRTFDGEISQLQDQLELERDAARSGEEQSAHWREAQVSLVERTRSDCCARVSELERERADAEETDAAEQAEAKQQLTKQKACIAALEEDLGRVRRLLAESKANLTWVQREKEKEEPQISLAKGQVMEDLRRVTSCIEASSANEAALQGKMEALVAQNRRDAERRAEELADANRKCASQLAELEARLKQVQCEYELRTKSSEEIHRDAVARTTERLDALTRSNEQLRLAMVSEGQGHSASFRESHWQVENNIQRLQRHTDELRSDIFRSEPSAFSWQGF